VLKRKRVFHVTFIITFECKLHRNKTEIGHVNVISHQFIAGLSLFLSTKPTTLHLVRQTKMANADPCRDFVKDVKRIIIKVTITLIHFLSFYYLIHKTSKPMDNANG